MLLRTPGQQRHQFQVLWVMLTETNTVNMKVKFKHQEILKFQNYSLI